MIVIGRLIIGKARLRGSDLMLAIQLSAVGVSSVAVTTDTATPGSHIWPPSSFHTIPAHRCWRDGLRDPSARAGLAPRCRCGSAAHLWQQDSPATVPRAADRDGLPAPRGPYLTCVAQLDGCRHLPASFICLGGFRLGSRAAVVARLMARPICPQLRK